MSNIRDIAKKANVSIATVSRILNNDPSFKASESTKKAIYKAIRDLNYKPVKKTKMTNIGCIMSIGSEKYEDPFFTTILAACETEAEKNNIIISQVRHYSELKNELVFNEFINSKLKGLIIMEKLPTDMLNAIKEKIPNIVYVDNDESTEEINTIGFDHRIANINAFTYLIENGYKRIGIIGESSPVTILEDSIRMSAYREVLRKNNIKYDPSIIKDCKCDVNICIKQAGELMSMKNPPDVLFVGSDTLASAVIAELKRLGYDCPKDIGVMGFNNLAISTHTNPSLTTVDIPMVNIGERTVKRLIEIMDKKDKDNLKILFPTKIIERESTRRIK